MARTREVIEYPRLSLPLRDRRGTKNGQLGEELPYTGRIVAVEDVYAHVQSCFRIGHVFNDGGEGILRRLYWKRVDRLELGNSEHVFDMLEKLSLENEDMPLAMKQTPRNPQNHHYLQVLQLLIQIRHPNICPTLAVFYDHANYGFIMKLLDGSDLSIRLPKKKTWGVVEQMLRTIAELHRHGICHRDIKLENFMCERETGKIVLVDFGCACLSNLPYQERQPVGSWYFMAPEVILGCECNEKIDEWSLGIALSYVLSDWSFPFKTDWSQWLRGDWETGDSFNSNRTHAFESLPSTAVPSPSSWSPHETTLGNVEDPLIPNGPKTIPFELEKQLTQRVNDYLTKGYKNGKLNLPAVNLLRALLRPNPMQRQRCDDILASLPTLVFA